LVSSKGVRHAAVAHMLVEVQQTQASCLICCPARRVHICKAELWKRVLQDLIDADVVAVSEADYGVAIQAFLVVWKDGSESSTETISCLQRWEAENIVECRADLADRSTWILTLAGLRSLQVGFVCRPHDPPEVLTYPGPGLQVNETWTTFQLLYALHTAGFEMSLLPARTSRATLQPYIPDHTDPLIYVR